MKTAKDSKPPRKAAGAVRKLARSRSGFDGAARRREEVRRANAVGEALRWAAPPA